MHSVQEYPRSRSDPGKVWGPMTLQATPSAERRFASIADVANLLGLPRSTMYERAKRRSIPGVVRVGQRILVDMSKLEPWLEAGGDHTEPEVE